MNVKKIIAKYNLTDQDIDRIVEMAWEDRTPFEAIQSQFGVVESEVIKIMKSEMRLRNWQKWRARVQGRATKHSNKRVAGVDRFHSKAQKMISKNVISKKKY